MIGLRARKKAERRALILDCGERLFAERGFDATPMEAIAASADISPATLYNFFPAKLDILTEIFGRQIDVQLSQRRKTSTGFSNDPASAILELVGTMFQTFDSFDRGLLRRVTLNALNEGPKRDAGARYVMAENDMQAEVAEVLQAYQIVGLLSVEMNVQAVSSAISACGNGEYYAWLGDDATTIEEVMTHICSHVQVILAAHIVVGSPDLEDRAK